MLAERGGFEPPVRFYPYNGLANRRFRPLSHLSKLPTHRLPPAFPGATGEKTLTETACFDNSFDTLLRQFLAGQVKSLVNAFTLCPGMPIVN
jgi:hypothetical protein